MNAEFFVLAFTAALNPKLLAIDLLLIENRRPRAMFLCVLIGGLTVGVTIGLLDVLVFHLDAIKSQKTVSAGVDLALGFLITSKSSTANQVIGVILFVLIEFLLIIIPFVFLALRPEATKAALSRSQEWLLGHARQLMAYTALILGAYLAVSGLVRLA